MPRRVEEPSVTLATRVPKSLRHAVKLLCTEQRLQVRDFVVQAIEERLAKVTGRPRR